MIVHLASHSSNIISNSTVNSSSAPVTKALPASNQAEVQKCALSSSQESTVCNSATALGSRPPNKVLGVVPANTSGATVSQVANIVCSECGFMTTKAAAMKSHMWIHIKATFISILKHTFVIRS